MKDNKEILLSVFVIGILMILPFIGMTPLTTKAQVDSSSTSSSVSASNSNNSNIAPLKISNMSTNEDITIRMAQISNSDKPEDIATLAYILGYPLITMQRALIILQVPILQSKGVVGSGPPNDIHFARDLVNVSFKDI